LIAAPGLFRCELARVEVETQGRWTGGMTVTDFAAAAGGHNALVAMSVDVAGFWDLVLGAWQRAGAAMSRGGGPGPGTRLRTGWTAARIGAIRPAIAPDAPLSDGQPRRARRRRGC